MLENNTEEGHEGVKWELGFAFFRGLFERLGNGILCTGTGIHETTIE